MLITLSPAKSLDFEEKSPIEHYTQPDFLESSEKLIEKLRKLSVKQIGKLMGLSEALSQLNYERYATWKQPFESNNAKQAMFAFRGDVYRGLGADKFNNEDIDFANNHLRIISGLYGLLRPLDLIQPYRLEMGTKLKVTAAKNNLYKYWGDTITNALNNQLESQRSNLLVNLASAEYYKAVNPKKINARIINPTFKEFKNGVYKPIMTYAKIARGLMTAYLIQNRIDDVDGVMGFNVDGYSYNPQLSKEDDLVFTRG